MPDLLLELFCEEIPSRMQRRASEDLQKLVTGGLVDAGLTYEGARTFVTPRRLALTVNGLLARSPDLRQERKGPRVGAPEKAVEGFLRGAGLSSIDEAQIVNDPKKGDFYVAITQKPGRQAEDLIAEIVPDVIRRFPWPKSMRWGGASASPGSLRWVRPLQSIVCTFGPETEDPVVIDFEIDGLRSSNVTRGHRFLAPDPIKVKRVEDYAEKLYKAHVMVDIDRRKESILADAKNQTMAIGLDLVEDPGLLEEAAGLVEWPIVMVGAFDEAFLDIPDEVIRTTIRENQKCFVVRDPATGNLANRFVLTSNLVAADGGAEIIKGNGKVIAARLSDAKFFWDSDLKTPLENRVEALNDIVFHEKLGTQFERVTRLRALAGEIAGRIGADANLADRAALLAKADLVTAMVYEFGELQGLMGRYYATAQGEDRAVATALEDHYKPQGPSDACPSDPVSIAVALADKLDILAGFWAIDEKPTGSKDPYALRRAALGIIRIVLENSVNFGVKRFLLSPPVLAALTALPAEKAEPIVDDLLAFLADRLKVYLRDKGARHDLIDAVFALGDQDDLLIIAKRVEALGSFLETDDGGNLLAGYRRAANILRAEEKKDDRAYSGPVDEAVLQEASEKALSGALAEAKARADTAIADEDFATAMEALSELRAPLDTVFEEILVNADDPALRENRLNLLNAIRVTMHSVADFSRIEG